MSTVTVKLTSRHDTPTGEEDTPTGEEDTPTYFHDHVFIYMRCFTWSVASVWLMQLPRGRDHRPQKGVARGRVFELTPLVAAGGVGVVHGGRPTISLFIAPRPDT